MALPRRVLNITRGWKLKHNQAVRAVKNCSAAWVEFGVSVRDLTLAESIAARNEQARDRDPLPYAEIRGIVYRPMERNEAGNRQEWLLMHQANKFVTEQHSAREIA